MISRILIILGVLTSSAFAQREILEDPEFKKKDKYWFLRKGKEYSKLKEEYKKGEFRLNISHTSESYYLAYLAEAPLKVGKSYKLELEYKGNGEGQIKANYRNHNNVFKKKKNKGNHRYSSLGLSVKLDPKAQWQKATMLFTATKNPVSEFDEFIIIHMGKYQGEVFLRNFSLKEAKDAPSPLPSNGKLVSNVEVK